MLGNAELELIDLWKKIAKLHGYPQRNNLNLKDIVKHLPNIGIFERIPDTEPAEFMIRLTGTKVDEMAGLNVAGMTVSSIISAEVNKIFIKNISKVIILPCAAAFSGKRITKDGKEITTIRLLLPFKGKTEDRPQILVFHNYDEEIKYISEGTDELIGEVGEWEFIDLGFGVPEE